MSYVKYFYHYTQGLWHGIAQVHLGLANDTVYHTCAHKKSVAKKLLEANVHLKTASTLYVTADKKSGKPKPSKFSNHQGNIIVTNLDRTINQTDLHEIFRQFGKINKIMLSKSGSALVKFNKKKSGVRAIREYNGGRIDGREMYIDVDQPTVIILRKIKNDDEKVSDNFDERSDRFHDSVTRIVKSLCHEKKAIPINWEEYEVLMLDLPEIMLPDLALVERDLQTNSHSRSKKNPEWYPNSNAYVKYVNPKFGLKDNDTKWINLSRLISPLVGLDKDLPFPRDDSI